MQRIMIIGPGGAGKSTLANKIGEKLNLPVFHLDKLFWQEGWVMLEKHKRQELVEGILKKEKWVMDGNFRSTIFDKRINKADTIVFLDFPRRITVPRWIKRVRSNRGSARPDVGKGNVEKFDMGYLKVILSNEHRYKDWEELKQKYPGKNYFILKNPKEVKEFVSQI